MEIKGTIIFKGETKEYGSNGFTKREFAVKTEEQYPQEIGLELVKDKCELLDQYNLGDNITVSINLRGNSWTNPQGEVKYFNSLQGWRIERDGSVSSETPTHETDTNPLPF